MQHRQKSYTERKVAFRIRGLTFVAKDALIFFEDHKTSYVDF